MSRSPRTAGRAIAPLFAAISFAFFVPGIFFGEVPVFRDLLVLSIPLRRFARNAIRSGAIPLWTSDLFFGAPFLADYQSAVFYPPSALLYWLPFAPGFSLFLAFHLTVAGWGMARYLERRRGLGASEAAFGGMVFSLGGFLVSLVPLTNQLVVAAWMPCALDAAEELAQAGTHRAFLRLTLLICLQGLGGGPETLLLTLTLIGASLANELRRGRARGRPCLAVALAVTLAGALLAAQLLPTAEYALQTNRPGGLPYEAVTAESLAPRSLLQLIFPHTFSVGAPSFVPEGSVPLFWSLYVGIAPIALAALAVTLAPLGFWPFIFYAALLMSFGDHTPLFAISYHLAPRLIGAFRFPGKFFLVSHFALALLAADGFARVTRERLAGRIAAAMLATLGALGAVIALAGSFAPGSLLQWFGYSIPSGLGASARAALAAQLGLVALRSSVLGLAAAVALRFFLRGGISHRSLVLFIAGLSGFDLFSVHQPSLVFTDWQSLLRMGASRADRMEPGERIFHYCLSAPRCVPENASGLGPWSGFLRPGEDAERQARDLWAALVPDAPMLYGLGAVAGSDGFSTRLQQDFFRTLAMLPRERAVHLLASLGVARLIGPEPLGPVGGISDPIEDGSSGTWTYALSAPAPRTYVAERIFTAPDAAAALARLAELDFHAGRDAVVVGRTAFPPRPAAGGEIRNLTIDADRIGADIELRTEALWVVADTWFPGWEATVDGVATGVVRANGILRGVSVPAGSHRVDIRYRPASFRSGCRISLAAAAVLLLETYAAAREVRSRT